MPLTPLASPMGPWGAGFAAPTSSVGLLQGGRLLHTYALTPAVGDYGQTAFSTGKDLVDVACPAERVCDAMGRDGTIVRTTDGGSTWRRAAVATPYLLNIACPTVTTCYAVGEQGTIVVTPDAERPGGVRTTH